VSGQTDSVLLAERNDFLIEGIRDLLCTVFSNVFVVSDARSLREGAARLHPSMVVMDVSIAEGDAATFVRGVRAEANAAVIVLTVHDAPDLAKQLLDAGADGIVLKHRLAIDLLSAVDTILERGRYVSSGIALKSLGSSSEDTDTRNQ